MSRLAILMILAWYMPSVLLAQETKPEEKVVTEKRWASLVIREPYGANTTIGLFRTLREAQEASKTWSQANPNVLLPTAEREVTVTIPKARPPVTDRSGRDTPPSSNATIPGGSTRTIVIRVYHWENGKWIEQKDRVFTTQDKQRAEDYYNKVRAVQGWTTTWNGPGRPTPDARSSTTEIRSLPTVDVKPLGSQARTQEGSLVGTTWVTSADSKYKWKFIDKRSLIAIAPYVPEQPGDYSINFNNIT